MTDDDIISAILEREGGDVAPPDRSGRISRWGVTAAALSEFRGHAVTDDEIRNLSATDARELYRRQYILKPGFHLIGSDALRAVLVDFGVNSGPATAVKALQRCLGVTADGIIGNTTAQAANVKDGNRLGVCVLAERVVHIGHLITADPSQAKFAHGWLRRIAAQIKELA